MMAPAGTSSSEAYFSEMKASRTSSRGKVAPIIRPSGSAVCMSFIECTARSIVAGKQRLLEFLGKEPLAADLGERPVEDAVARGLDDINCDIFGLQAMRGGQPVAHLVRLGERQGRAARPDAYRRSCLQLRLSGC